MVDAENVRRSAWPNRSKEELVAMTRAWAEREGFELLVVFDGAPPQDEPDLLGSGSRSAHARLRSTSSTFERFGQADRRTFSASTTMGRRLTRVALRATRWCVVLVATLSQRSLSALLVGACP